MWRALFLIFVSVACFGESAAQLQACGNNTTFLKCDQAQGVVIRVADLIPNPYHALYQEIWPLVYVVRRLFQQTQYLPKESVLVVHGTSINWDGCTNRRRRKDAGDVLWQNCVLLLVAKRLGIGKVVLASHFQQPKSTDFVFHTSPIFHSHPGFHAVDSVNRVNFTVPVVKEHRADTLRFIRDSVIEQVLGEREHRPKKNFMHVVVYDRLDANWRVWSNSPDIMPHIENDPRVHVTHVREFPTVFTTQVRLVRDADVLVGPHGAAFANTIFLRDESTVLEIWKCCGQKIEGRESLPRAWTGWHQPLFGWKLRYVPCKDNKTGLIPAEEVKDSLWCPNDEPTARLGSYIVEADVLAREINEQVKMFFERRKDIEDDGEREKVLVEREKEVEMREKKVEAREIAIEEGGGDGIGEKEEVMKRRELAVEEREQKIVQREDQLSKREQVLGDREQRVEERETQADHLEIHSDPEHDGGGLELSEEERVGGVEYHLERQLSIAVIVCAVATALMSGFMIGRMSNKRKCGY